MYPVRCPSQCPEYARSIQLTIRVDSKGATEHLSPTAGKQMYLELRTEVKLMGNISQRVQFRQLLTFSLINSGQCFIQQGHHRSYLFQLLTSKSKHIVKVEQTLWKKDGLRTYQKHRSMNSYVCRNRFLFTTVQILLCFCHGKLFRCHSFTCISLAQRRYEPTM